MKRTGSNPSNKYHVSISPAKPRPAARMSVTGSNIIMDITNRWVEAQRIAFSIPNDDPEEPNDMPYKCHTCGKANNNDYWSCEDCEDPLGGDGEDD